MSNGRYAMTLVSRFISQMAPDITCHQFCVGVTRAFRDVYLPLWRLTGRQSMAELLAAHPEERLCASAVVYSNRRREIWLVGDCQCLVGGELCENPKPYEQRLAEMRAVKVRELLAQGQSPDKILADDQARAAIIPQMLREMQQQNKTYAVIDGFPIPETRVPVIALDFRPWEIVFASDGYPFLPQRPAQYRRLQGHKRLHARLQQLRRPHLCKIYGLKFVCFRKNVYLCTRKREKVGLVAQLDRATAF